MTSVAKDVGLPSGHDRGSAESDVGIHLDAVEVFTSASQGVAGPGHAGAAVARHANPTLSRFPPAALVPRIDGEPIRADLAWPPHPRGIGESWPPEARVYKGQLPGRFPLAFAWSMLPTDDCWTWTGGAEPVRPSKAIAAIIAQLLSEIYGEKQHGRHALVVPNSLPLMAQQKLIDECRRLGVEVKLLWRPVAAAMEWCDKNSETLTTGSAGETALPKILVLHLGIEDWEVTWLDVIQQECDGRAIYIPARRRPNAQCAVTHGLGLALIHQWALEHVGQRSVDEDVDAARVWNLLWASNWLKQALQQMCEGAPPIPEQNWFSDSDATSALHRLLAVSSCEVDVGNGWMATVCPRPDGSAWWNVSRELVADKQFVGAVAIGPLAGIRVGGAETLGAAAIAKLCGPIENILVEGVDLPRGFLADAAARYLAKLRARIPTYMDSLPKLRTAVYVQGEPQWISLLTDEFCPGGERWPLPGQSKRLGGFEIPENQEELEIVVDHEEHETVRKAIAPLHNRTSQKIPVKLDISIEPAAGNAEIRVIPEDVDALGRRSVYVEWERMSEVCDRNGAGLSASDWVQLQPTLFPPVRMRLSSEDNWAQHGCDSLRNCIAVLLNPFYAPQDLSPCLRELTRSLRKKAPLSNRERASLDHKRDAYEKSATVLDSEGEPPLHSDLPRQFAELASARMRNADRDEKRQLLLALAATATPNVQFQKYLATKIANTREPLDQPHLSAIGWCLREPTIIRDFARRMTSECDPGHPNLWLKAFGEILRYRENATSEIPSDDRANRQFNCERLIHNLLKILRAQRNHTAIYRNAALCVTYLLRRRRQDDGFFDPDSFLAIKVKQEFRRMIDAFPLLFGRRPGGAIPLLDLLELAIKYINRKGPDILSANRILQDAAD